MAFRPIDPDKSLNVDQDLGGDEIVSIFERLCTKYDLDQDVFWAQIDFRRYFFGEIAGCFPLAFILEWLRYHLRDKRDDPCAAEEPFTIDDLVRIMNAARRTET